MKYETQGVMSINALAITGDKKGIWFIHGTLPLLLRYDFNSQEIVKVAVIPCSTKGMLQQALFKGIYQYNNKLFLIPNNAEEVFVYSIANNQFHAISIKEPCRNMFCGCLKKGNKLYCIPYRYRSLVSVDLNNYEV